MAIKMNCIGKCARNGIEEGQDERSHLSAISFPSLNFIYSQDEEDGADDLPPEASPTFSYDVDEDTDGAGILDVAFCESDDDDGYPTDEHSLTLPEEKRQRRLHILQLARHRLACKATNDAPADPEDDEESGDDSTFLGNVDVADVECAAPDDSTFLADAAVEDVATDVARSFDEHIGDIDTVASTYNLHASNLSRASTRASTIGDQILKESAKAARMAKSEGAGNGPDTQSTSTYSYRKAFADNITLGSTRASACSALTDDYCYDARKTGMSDAVMQRKVPEEEPCDGGELRRVNSGPADVDTGKEMLASGISREGSLARPPPPCLPYHSSNAMIYENYSPEHLARVVSFADGEGYVDEEAAHKDERDGCCGWFASSPRAVKLIVLFSTLLMLVSVASLSIALLMPEGSIFGSRSSAASSDISALDANGSGPDGNYSVESTDWLNGPPALKNDTKAPAQSSSQDIASGAPTSSPSGSPEEGFVFSASSITKSPSKAPSGRPTLSPTAKPTPSPTTRKPTNLPTPPPSKEPTRQPTATQVLTMRATRDTYVSQSSPDENYGTSSRFKIDGAPSRWSFIAFDADFATENKNTAEIKRQSSPAEKDEPRALETIRVVEAKLRMYTLGDEGGGCLVYALPNANWWPESGVTWDNQYEIVDRGGTSFAGSSGWTDAYSWYEIDVTAALQSRMVRSFLIKSSSSNGVSFASRERGGGAYAPELVLKFQIGSD